MPRGKIIHYDPARGFGFVQNDDDQSRTFVHVSALVNAATLSVGQRIEYDVRFDHRRSKYRADQVKVLA